jgi:hypothetical protein
MPPFKLALIFTGHMVDLPGREPPRFPPEMEDRARTAIWRRIAAAKKAADGSMIGIASGARGGDILFLEGCEKAGLPIRIVLPFAAQHFLESSVRGANGGDWETRFRALLERTPEPHSEVLAAPDGENPYDFCNRRMLALAAELGQSFRLVALWDGKDTELKPGGTASFVALVRQSGGHFAHINSEALLAKLGAGSLNRRNPSA